MALNQPSKWEWVNFEEAVEIWDFLRKPINSKERAQRISDKNQEELYPYYGATGQVGYIDSYLSDGEYVLLGEDGAPFLAPVANKAYLIQGKAWVNNHAHVLRSKYNNKFLCYYLNQFNYNGFVTGTTRYKLTQAAMKRIPIPVPSPDEQERIVSKVEELFSRLDASVAELQTAKEKLKVYRQAVLKEAFDQAVSMGAKEMTIDNLLVQTRKGMSTGPFGAMLKKHEHQREGVPVLGIENIGEGKFISGNKIFVSAEKAVELQAFRLHAGDIIISRSGTVGELCVVPPHMENALLSTNLMRISLNQEIVLSPYFVYLFQSKGVVIDQVKELCKGSTRMFLNQTILKQIRFPIPSIPVQQKLINLVESQLSICDSIAQAIDTSLHQAEALRQSILKQAFEGKL